VPNIHVRDLPPETVDALKAAARRNRRSLNAEIVDALVQHAGRRRDPDELIKQLEEGRRRWQRWFPDGYPEGLAPEEVIRRHRDGG
jgi:plasmid stability protein